MESHDMKKRTMPDDWDGQRRSAKQHVLVNWANWMLDPEMLGGNCSG